MKKTQALHNFFSGFEIKAYPSQAVPKDAEPPYLTYAKGMSPDGFSSTVHIYHRTTSELIADDKVEEICNALRNGGKKLFCDDGQLWLTLEQPEWYAGSEEDSVKHRIINVSIVDLSQGV